MLPKLHCVSLTQKRHSLVHAHRLWEGTAHWKRSAAAALVFAELGHTPTYPPQLATSSKADEFRYFQGCICNIQKALWLIYVANHLSNALQKHAVSLSSPRPRLIKRLLLSDPDHHQLIALVIAPCAVTICSLSSCFLELPSYMASPVLLPPSPSPLQQAETKPSSR